MAVVAVVVVGRVPTGQVVATENRLSDVVDHQ